MRIEIIGDDSIAREPRIYAEYRLFAALSQVVDTGRVDSASLVLSRRSHGHCDGVGCTVRVELHSGDSVRVRAWGSHPYAAINRAVDRLRMNAWRTNHWGRRHDTHNGQGRARAHGHERTGTETHGAISS